MLRPILLSSALFAATPAASAQQTGDLLFISPMGEPYRGTSDAPPEVAWFNQVDANHDGKLTREEMVADADRFFKRLDVDGDGEIDPSEIERYETLVAPEVTGRAPAVSGFQYDPSIDGPDSFKEAPKPQFDYANRSGGAMFSYLGLPEPVIAADTNFDRGVSLREFEQAALYRFRLLDVDRNGVLEPKEFPDPPRKKVKRRK